MLFLKKSQIRKMAGISAALMSLALLWGCAASTSDPTQGAQEQYAPQIKITTADTTVTGEDATTIDLEEIDSVCSITEPGCFLLSGNLRGQVQIDAQDQVVHLILGGVEVESFLGPALNVISAGKVIITLADGTENTFRDTAEYPKESQENACVFSQCDLTFNGTGKLNVTGYYQDGIRTKDVLKILGGNVFVQAKRDGIRGNDGIAVTCQALTVQSERHGLYTTKTGKPAKGNVEIYGGDHSVIAGGYAISCMTDLYVNDCALYTAGVLGNYHVSGRSFIGEGADA